MNEPFQNELRQISVKNLLEGGREALSYSAAAAALSQQTKAAVAAVTRETTQWGELQDFSIITSGAAAASSHFRWSNGASITHAAAAAETALQKSNHAFFGWWAGNRYLNRTELLGTNGSFGIEEGPQTEVEKGPACLSEQRRNLQSLEGISGTGKMCCCRDGSRKLHASWIDARRSRGGFQLRTISLQRRAKSFSTHQGASCTHYRAF